MIKRIARGEFYTSTLSNLCIAPYVKAKIFSIIVLYTLGTLGDVHSLKYSFSCDLDGA